MMPMMSRTGLLAAWIALMTMQGADAKPRRHHHHHAPAAQAAPKDEGPDLPWPCWVVRLKAAAQGFTSPLTPVMKRKIAQLEKENAITPKQHRQAEQCFRPKP